MQTLEENFRYLYESGFSGKDIDRAVVVIAHLFIKEKPFITCIVYTEDCLCCMCSCADHIISTRNGERGGFIVAAIYSDTSNFPLPRLYLLNPKDSFELRLLCCSLEKKGYIVKDASFGEMREYFPSRRLSGIIDEYNRKRWNNLPLDFKKIVAGRGLFVSVDKFTIINTDGCLCCDSNKGSAVTSSVGGSVLMCVLFRLCDECLSGAMVSGSSLLKYISNHFGADFKLDCSDYTFSDVADALAEVLVSEMDCKDVERKDGFFEIHATRRSSGYKLIFRLNSPSNYAYIILDEERKEVGRFDSATHHEVDGGPHHLHYHQDKKCYAKVVFPSWFIGCPLFDMKGFKAFLELNENKSRNMR